MPCSCLLATKLIGIRYQHVINNLKTKVVLFFEKKKVIFSIKVYIADEFTSSSLSVLWTPFCARKSVFCSALVRLSLEKHTQPFSNCPISGILITWQLINRSSANFCLAGKISFVFQLRKCRSRLELYSEDGWNGITWETWHWTVWYDHFPTIGSVFSFVWAEHWHVWSLSFIFIRIKIDLW